MFVGKDLLAVGLVVAAGLFVARALRAPSILGRAGPAPPCEVPVELSGQGVACLGRAEAERRGLRAGAHMRPDRLAAWEAPVDVNRASVEELASLDGIGPKLAARIVAARPYRSVEEVAGVRGIGRRRLARLRARLLLDEQPVVGVR
ncbi:MAG: helix-hairpin-helix protein [Myxococcales bacterium]|nr:helix-hairpin-helix protein [Myxococcales bacterium]